ncbi:hypothetical protein TSUD_276510 [Trifolium subterraneum]|uniref:Uncharacterized protein n=1 Tax=Trifolium subterraneum TaxID=3900 RepID=A0A2Z6N7H4_TRISU|nr:hypothetical protein TSUD_276510 [Trifolium subterraneum]
MVRRRVRPALCIESLNDKGGQTTCPVECGQRQCKCMDEENFPTDIISQKSLSSSKGWTSLHIAAVAGQLDIMQKLVEIGALLTEKDSEGYTPFA